MSEKRRRRAELRVYHSKRDNDTTYWASGHQGCTAARHYMHHVISKEVVLELDRRGYDVTTLRFSIARKPGMEGCVSCDTYPCQCGPTEAPK